MKKKNQYLICVLIVGIFYLLIRFILNFDGLYGQDAYEYLRYTKALNLYYKSGINPGDYFWPLYYPIFGSVLSFVFNPIFSLQLISVVSFLLTIIYISKSIELIYPKKELTLTYSILLFGFSPYVFRLGFTVMSDMLCTLFITLCFYNGILYLEKEKIKNLYLIVLFGISATMTRYAAFIIILPIGMYILFILLKKKKHIKHLFFLFLLLILLLIPHYLIRQNNSSDFLNHTWVTNWSLKNIFESSFNTVDALSLNYYPNIIYAFSSVFHPRYFAFGLLFLIIFLKQRLINKKIVVFAFAFILYAIFLAGIPYQNNRYLLLSFPLLIVVFYSSFQYLIEKIKSKRNLTILLIIIGIFQISLCFYGLKAILERNSLEKNIAQEIKPYQNQTLYSFDIDIALKGRNLNFNYISLWAKKYDSFENGALVLFHPTNFSKIWEGRNPMLNWGKLNKEYLLKPIKNLPNGWMLYEIKNKSN